MEQISRAAKTRAQNMEKRRRRILAAAHELIATKGFNALSLRVLAAQAGVTVPTIYNLIGNKEAILVALYAEILAEIERRVAQYEDLDPIRLAESMVIESTELFAEDEQYSRAAVMAVEYLNYTDHHHATVARFYYWGERMGQAGCEACRSAGLLRGRIPSEVLGAQILRGYLTSLRAWMYGHISLTELRRHGLIDVYVALAADAVETFQGQIARKIIKLKSASHESLEYTWEESS